MTWIVSCSAQRVELVEPDVCEVNFRDIAWSLAHTNRYGGNPHIPISVGLHTLIGFDLVRDDLRAHWLIHDAHESRIGDMMRPTREALYKVADQLDPGTSAAVDAALRELETRHARVIHAAAGIPMPSPAQKAMIAQADLRCMATEKRDFHREGGPDWPSLAGVEAARSLRKFMPPDKVADQLATRFERYLPALRGL